MLSKEDLLKSMAHVISLEYSEKNLRKFIASLRTEVYLMTDKTIYVMPALYEEVVCIGNEHIKEEYKNFEDCFEMVYSISDYMARFPDMTFLYFFSKFYKEKLDVVKVITIRVSSKEIKERLETVRQELLRYSYKYANIAKISVVCR